MENFVNKSHLASIPLDGKDLTKIVRSLLEISSTLNVLENQVSYSHKDLWFFATASEAILNWYWSTRDEKRNIEIAGKLRLMFPGENRDIFISKILYLQSYLREIIDKNHGSDLLDVPNNINVALGFGSGDLVYQKHTNHRLQIEGSSVFPKLGTDFFGEYQLPGQNATSGLTQISHSSHDFPSHSQFASNFKQPEDLSPDNGERVFNCADCSMSFKRNSDLKRHVQIHVKPLPHICAECGKSFARKDALKRHSGTQTCKRNRENGTHLDNLKYLRGS